MFLCTNVKVLQLSWQLSPLQALSVYPWDKLPRRAMVIAMAVFMLMVVKLLNFFCDNYRRLDPKCTCDGTMAFIYVGMSNCQHQFDVTLFRV